MLTRTLFRPSANAAAMLWRGVGRQTGLLDLPREMGIGLGLERVGKTTVHLDLDLMKTGALVADDLVLSLARARLSQRDCVEGGWVLDGVPRTRRQALALVEEHDIKPQIVVHLKGDVDEIVARISDRRVDPLTGNVYNLKTDRPKDRKVLERLVRRSDDEQAVVRERLAVYDTNMPHVWDVLERASVDIVQVDTRGRGIGDILETVRDRVEGHKKVVIAGCPGVGKGSVGSAIGQGRVHVSSGDLLRKR